LTPCCLRARLTYAAAWFIIHDFILAVN